MTGQLLGLCCCGEPGPSEGCPSQETCEACGDLEWRVRGTLIRDIVDPGGGIVQREVWSFQTLDIVTRDAGGTICRWLNNRPTSGSDVDFLSYSGTYTVVGAGGFLRSASFNFQTPPAPSTWGTDNQCSPITSVDTMFVQAGTGFQAPDDQTGALLNVSPPVLLFVRNANQDCPIGTFNGIELGGIFEYPSLPFLESVDI